MANPIDDIDNILMKLRGSQVEPTDLTSWNNTRTAIKNLLLEARNNALLDLEQWIKLHDLGQDMILDGIEHMVKSNLQVPYQPRLNHADRIAALQKELE